MKNKLEDEELLVKEETKLIKKVSSLKGLCEKGDSYWEELEISRRKNLRINHPLSWRRDESEVSRIEDANSVDLYETMKSRLEIISTKQSRN